MANLIITQYSDLAEDGRGNTMQIGQEPALDIQVVAIGASAAQSTALNKNCKLVTLHAEANCFVLFGAGTPAPSATTGQRIVAGQDIPRGVRVPAGTDIKIGVIQE